LSGLFLINILVSTAVTIYIVMYPAEWIIDLMEVRLFIFECLLLPITMV